MIVATLGNTVGSLIAYAIGAWGVGRSERYGKYITSGRSRIEQPPSFFVKWGADGLDRRLLDIVRTFISFRLGSPDALESFVVSFHGRRLLWCISLSGSANGPGARLDRYPEGSAFDTQLLDCAATRPGHRRAPDDTWPSWAAAAGTPAVGARSRQPKPLITSVVGDVTEDFAGPLGRRRSHPAVSLGGGGGQRRQAIRSRSRSSREAGAGQADGEEGARGHDASPPAGPRQGQPRQRTP